MAPHKKQQQQQQASNKNAVASEMVNARTKNKALKDQLSNLNRMTKSDAKQLASLTKEVEDLRDAVKELMKLSKRPGQKPTKMELDKVIPENVRSEVIDAAYAPTRSPSEERGRQQTNSNGNKNHKAAPSSGVRATQPQQRQGNNKRYNSSKVVAENQLKNMLGMAPVPPRQRPQQQGKRNGQKQQQQTKQGEPDNELAQSIREKLRRASTKEEVRAATNMARAVGMTYEAGLGDKKLSTLA